MVAKPQSQAGNRMMLPGNAALSLNGRRRLVRMGARARAVDSGGCRGGRGQRPGPARSGSHASGPKASSGCVIAPVRLRGSTIALMSSRCNC